MGAMIGLVQLVWSKMSAIKALPEICIYGSNLCRYLVLGNSRSPTLKKIVILAPSIYDLDILDVTLKKLLKKIAH